MIGGDAEMRRAFCDHLPYGIQDAGYRSKPHALVAREAPQPLEVPKELVGTVDKMNDHVFSRTFRKAA